MADLVPGRVHPSAKGQSQPMRPSRRRRLFADVNAAVSVWSRLSRPKPAGVSVSDFELRPERLFLFAGYFNAVNHGTHASLVLAAVPAPMTV